MKFNFSAKLIHWYQSNKRDLPWRKTSDPYLIWLSEIILQQTRVDQGINYYLNFSSQFSDVHQLAKASEEKILKMWQGLGYYSRARNLHATARLISKEYKGKFPEKYEDILKLKGVGQYTAAAISSFAFNKSHAVVDGNVYRVLSRVFGLKTPIDSNKGKQEFNELATSLIDNRKPGMYNQAIMEFGALQCKPKNPDCNNCVMNDKCVGLQKRLVDQLPVKLKTTKQRNRYFNYLVIRDNQSILLKKRVGNDIWKNLYDFPMLETLNSLSELEFLDMLEKQKIFSKSGYILKKVSASYKHILSHQKIYAKFWEISIQEDLSIKECAKIPLKKLHQYAIPKLIDTYLTDENYFLIS